MRIGLHAGEPVADSNDLSGAAVQLAARLCDAAAAYRAHIAAAGSRQLKGLPRPTPSYAIDWR